MDRKVNIDIIGDYDSSKPSHIATNAAIGHAAGYLKIKIEVTWMPTPSFLTGEGKKNINLFDAVWVSPSSPYQNTEGALEGIKLARETDRPLIGT
jgi:CTP synthase (UTP-ammonia lyase)